MKRLFLLRHAKAGFGTTDQSRPLAPRGTKDAFWLGQYFKKSGLLPDYVICSSAARTRETLDQVEGGAKAALNVTFRDSLYLASAGQIARQIQHLDPAINAPMVIGHNPGLSQLFQTLTHNPPRDSRSLKYPTCTVAIVDFDIDDWSDLKSNTGQLFKVIIPSDIRKTDI